LGGLRQGGGGPVNISSQIKVEVLVRLEDFGVRTGLIQQVFVEERCQIGVLRRRQLTMRVAMCILPVNIPYPLKRAQNWSL
jgi:hypothetical protein